MKELFEIQQQLEMKKERHNDFQNFYYWNMDDVLKKVRPVLAKLDCVLTFSDEIIEKAGRVFLCATVTLKNVNTGECESCTASAEISAEKENGMNKGQMTGAASTYARKYALNGLFAINDERDVDEINAAQKPAPRQRGAKRQPAPMQPVQPMMPVAPMQGFAPAAPLAPNTGFDVQPMQTMQPVQPMMPVAPAKPKKPKALTKEQYNQLIVLSANGQLLKTGEDPRQWYFNTYKCGQKQIEFFDNAVNKLREEMMNQMPTGRDVEAQQYEQYAAQSAPVQPAPAPIQDI